MERIGLMGVYRVNEDELNRAIGTLNHIHNKLERCYDDLNRTYRSLQNQSGLGIQNVKYTINAQKETLRIQKHNVQQIRDCVQSIINKTKEASVNAQKILESVDLSKAMVDAAAVATGVAGAVTGAGGGKNNAAPANPTGAGNNSTAISGRIPGYALEGNEPDANGIYGSYVRHKDGSFGKVCEWNRTGQLSCTYYTLRKLNERGISFPCVAGPGNGANWYNNFDFETGLPTYGGSNALRDLADTMSLPQNNIVVSFDRPLSDQGTVLGHVMLIDEIYRDANGTIQIVSSDMYPDIASLNGTNPQVTRTIDEFYSYYNKYNGNMVGLCVLGNK